MKKINKEKTEKNTKGRKKAESGNRKKAKTEEVSVKVKAGKEKGLKGKKKMPKINKDFLAKAVLFIIGGGIVTLLLALGNLLIPKEEEILEPPLKVPQKVEYRTHEAYYDSIVKKSTNRGFFVSENQVDLSFSNRDGYLKRIYVSVGDSVRKGDLLAVLDTDMINNDISRQKITLQASEDLLANLKNRSQMDISVSKLQLEELKNDLEAKKQLSNTISRVELEKIENQVKINEQMLSMKEYDYSSQILSAERDIELAELQLDVLELELKKSRMTATSDGVIEYVAYIHEGEYIPAYKKIITISDPHRLLLQYKGTNYTDYYLGMQVSVKIDDEVFSGEVVVVPTSVPSEEFEQMKDTVLIRVNNLPYDVERGNSAVIEAVLDWADNVLVLPNHLVKPSSNGYYVKVMEDGIVNQRDVKIGIKSATLTEIRGGIEAGDLIVE